MRQCGSPRSYIDDLFARNNEKCKALPAPKNHTLPYNANRSRYASSDSQIERYDKPSLWNRIFHRARIREERQRIKQKSLPDYSFNNNGSYEETSAQLFNLSRALSRNPTGAELKLRCTEFDKNGNVTLVSGEFKKSELIAKYGLMPRDLRKIDSSVLPHILVRPTAILLNLLHLRVLIQSDRVLVFDAYGSTDSYTQSLFMYDLEGKLRQKQTSSSGADNAYLPYEFRALEAVLISVTSGLEAEFALVREPVTQILRALEEDIDREKLRHLLIHSKKLGTFEQKARLVRDALDELLEADDDLASMYLTERKRTGKPRPTQEHTEAEMLLESYHKICDEVVEISGNLISNIRNTEEVVKAILDANRNQLMLFEIKVSIATLGLAGGTLVAGWYGMVQQILLSLLDIMLILHRTSKTSSKRQTTASARSLLVRLPSAPGFVYMASANSGKSRKSVCGVKEAWIPTTLDTAPRVSLCDVKLWAQRTRATGELKHLSNLHWGKSESASCMPDSARLVALLAAA